MKKNLFKSKPPGRLVATSMSFLTAVFICSSVTAQPSSISDTIKIGDVVVKGRPMLKGAGFHIETINKNVSEEFANGSVADVLVAGSPFFMKSYGPGGLSTVSFRGGNASHTVLTWNGVNMNSPMLGQSDFQLIPVVMTDDIKIYQGGSTVAAAQGGLGGVIDISTGPVWSETFSTDLSASLGGYGRYSGSVNSRYGKGAWRFSTRLNYNYGANDFNYRNTELPGEPVKEIRSNASFVQKAALQEAWFRKGNSVTGLRVWFQNYDRDVPTAINIPLGTYDENLSGNTTRTMFSHDHYGKKMVWSGLIAHVNDDMVYRDDISGFVAPSTFNRLTVRGSGLWNEGGKTTLKGEVTSEFENVDSDNFAEVISRNISYLSLAADHSIKKYLNFNMNVVVPLIDGVLEIPDLSAGIEVSPVPSRELKVRSNIAYKSKIPTMNDLYWIYGGNSSLLPEHALSSELAISGKGKVSEFLSINIRAGIYLNYITDMIQWQPETSGLWSPVNVGRVYGRGFESNVALSWTNNKTSVTAGADYSYTRSSEDKLGPQLIYVPKQMANGSVRVSSGKILSGLSIRHTGTRYVTADNSGSLPDFTVTDIWAGVKLPFKAGNLNATLRIENLFNVQYQVIAYHPMPQSSVMLNLAWSFRKTDI